MGKFKITTGLILIFLVGVLSGVLGATIYGKYHMKKIVAGDPSLHQRTNLLRRGLSKRLDLTNQQEIEIGNILRESQDRIFEIRLKYLPEIKRISDQSFIKIKEKLDPYQREKLDELHKKLKERRARALFRRGNTKHMMPFKKDNGRH